MSEQWYCPQCGPVTSGKITALNRCETCGIHVQGMDGMPPFVFILLERVEQLETICAAIEVQFMENPYETIRPEVLPLMRKAHYLKEPAP
jgi:hypothetical protein